MFNVKDGRRTLQFEGVKLAHSSSWRAGSVRWIEFTLYRTESGSYVLSRVGVSLVYHAAACPLVRRYGLQEESIDKLQEEAVPCPECRPTLAVPVAFPERLRWWAQVSDDADAVLEALYKEDDNGARYLTKVAQRLLEDAAAEDSNIDQVYRIEYIA